MSFKRRFLTEVFMGFLRCLVGQVPRYIFLIIDRHPVHVAVKVKNWLKKNEKPIQVFYLHS